jgi:uncharacterized protein YeaO (DUF488 family)
MTSGDRAGEPRVAVRRVYEDPGPTAGEHRVLVDRLWPRGVRKQALQIDEWLKEAAPSTELRRWYGHAPERFAEFGRRYRRELARPPARDALDRLVQRARDGRLVLLTATRDVDHSGASVLRAMVDARIRGADDEPGPP